MKRPAAELSTRTPDLTTDQITDPVTGRTTETEGIYLAEIGIEFINGFPPAQQGPILAACRRRLQQEGGVFRRSTITDNLE